MSSRFRRQTSKACSSSQEVMSVNHQSSGTVARKRRRPENVSSDDEERSVWTPKHLGDLKAYNRNATEAPAELFRKDLISAMKLPDNEPLTLADYWGLSDPWKQEWERGVQVPVNPDSLPGSAVKKIKEHPKISRDFRLPRRFIRVNHSEFFSNERHILSNLPTKAEKMCRYDMDNLDEAWLKAYNGERMRMGADPVPQYIFELILEHLEETCWENIHKLLKNEKTLAIEFDEDVICDVCRSPDREEGNEMVFCDICNICVHQACYGITAIPSGSWLCKTCSLGIKPNCDLCPNKGGAMKSTKSGHKWAHVACALWIPEVSIGSVERMEPITKIANIPQSRWALVCVLCRERRGACIQCSVKSCKTAYHVTCAFKHGLEMKAIIEDESADDVKLRSYCEKHSLTGKKEKENEADSDGAGSSSNRKKKELSAEQARAAKLRQIEAEFYNHVDPLETSTHLDIDFETTETIFYYWKLKRRSGFNKPLLTPRSEELDLLSHQQEQDIERMKMFVQLRQYLERVRNLCYMVSRREKLSRSYLRTREQTFCKQVEVLEDPSVSLSSQEKSAVIEANHGSNVYDAIFSHSRAPVHSASQFEDIIHLITNSGPSDSSKCLDFLSPKKKSKDKDVNGLIKNRSGPTGSRERFRNPYRRNFFNGAEERRSRSHSTSQDSTTTSSTEDSESSLPSTKWQPPDPGGRISVFTSSEDEHVLNKNKRREKSPVHVSPRKKFFQEGPEDPGLKSTRGRGGTLRRGRGRPPMQKGLPRSNAASRPKESATAFSSEDEKPFRSDSQAFDALMKSPSWNIQNDISVNLSPVKKEPKLRDSSDDESKSKARRGRPVMKRAVKKEEVSSSEEDVPSLKTPPKRGKGRGRGRGSSTKKPNTAVSSNPLSSWTLPSKPSDEEDSLGPATYKLTSSDEEKSDRSSRVAVRTSRKDLFGYSSDDKSDRGGSGNRKEMRRTRSSDNEVEGSDDGESESRVKTKAAMKEFTSKIDSKGANVTAKVLERSAKTKIETSKDFKEDIVGPTSTTDVDLSLELSLFVPQRAAAKKASKLITSQNTGAVPNVPAGAGAPALEADAKKLPAPKETSESNASADEAIKKNSSKANRRGRSSNERQDRSSERRDKDDSSPEPPKKNIFETPEILPYVPVREAARKATENMKGTGGSKVVIASSLENEDVEVTFTTTTTETIPSTTVVSTPVKPKRGLVKPDAKVDLKSTSTTRSRLRSSRKNFNSESDSAGEETSPLKEESKGAEDAEKPKSIFSESDDENLASKKERSTHNKNVVVEKGTSNKQQLFRGDIFLKDHQSSSENDDNHAEPKAPKGVSKSPTKTSIDSRRNADATKSTRSSRTITRLFGSDEHEAENEEPPADFRKKAPDKKLKTSDGRPEHGFQPPVTSRDESEAPAAKRSQISEPESAEHPEKHKSRTKRKSEDDSRGFEAAESAAYAPPPSILSPRQEKSRRERRLDGEKDPEKVNSQRPEVSGVVDKQNSQFNEGALFSKEQLAEQSKTVKTGPTKGFKSTFECITPSIKEEEALVKSRKMSPLPLKPINAFNFTEQDVEIKRLDDIIESPDPEPDPKKLKINDSDEEALLFIDKKVEQPKDSGYKSAIATPEPIDRPPTVYNEIENSPPNSVLTERLSPLLDINISNKKSRSQPLSSPPHLKTTANKSVFYGRRKNLEDVIEERKKIAEQSEIMAATSAIAKKTEMELRNQELDGQETSKHPSEMGDPTRSLMQASLKNANATGTLPSTVCTTSSATSSFVEEWREQWVKSPQPPMQKEHDSSSTYPHHPPLNALKEFPYPYLDSRQANFSTYLSHYNMMQFALLHQQYEMSHKSHDQLLDEMAAESGLGNRLAMQKDLFEHARRLEQSQVKLTAKESIPLPTSSPKGDKLLLEHKEFANSKSMAPVSIVHSSSTPTFSDSSKMAKQFSTEADKVTSKIPIDSLSVQGIVSTTSTDSVQTFSVSSINSKMSPVAQPLDSMPNQTDVSSVHGPYMKHKEEMPIVSESLLVSTKNSSMTYPSLVVTSTSHLATCSTSTAVTSSISSVTCSNSSDKISSPKVAGGQSGLGHLPGRKDRSISSPSSTAAPSSPDKKALDAVQSSPKVHASIQSPPQKRVPIYMQEPKTPKESEKRSPRAVSSPRQPPRERREARKTSRGRGGKTVRGRGAARGKKRGGSTRYSNAVSVPKELVGTVYEFDDDFDDDGPPANNALDDLRMLRVKRHSVDATPVHQPSLTPTYIQEIEDKPPKKRVKEKKIKSNHKERTPRRDEIDEVAKILEDYKNQQNSTLKRSVHEPSPPHISLPNDFSNKYSSPSHDLLTENPMILDSSYTKPDSIDKKEEHEVNTGAAMVASLPEDRTNQLKLKIKGPYANSYVSSNLAAPAQEISANPVQSSTTTTLRRMRKKELIMQYWNQDANHPEQADGSSSTGYSSTNPQQQLRTGITVPKAVASMTSIPTREDYKMYTQDEAVSSRGSTTSGRRKRQTPRELKQLDWTLLDDAKGKRNSESTSEMGKKRTRVAKDNHKQSNNEGDNSSELIGSGKLRISIGKKVISDAAPLSTAPVPDSKGLGNKGKPPKKRHEDVFSRVMSDSLKFREEIMANFDKGHGKRKKRTGAGSETGSSSPLSSEMKEDTGSNDGQQKIVLKISKNKSENGSLGSEDRLGSAPTSVPTHPLKIRLNLASFKSGDDKAPSPGKGKPESSGGDSPGLKMKPLKLKLKLRPEGYVTSKSTSHTLDQGPGPPPEPPDPPSEQANADVNATEGSEAPTAKENIPPEDKAEVDPLCIAENPPTLDESTENAEDSSKAPISRLSDDVIQRLEAQLAATDGGLPLPDSLKPPMPDSCNPSALQGSECR